MSNEIKVADVDQVKELFTALKDKMNSLKIIEIKDTILDFSESPIFFTTEVNSNLSYTHSGNFVTALVIAGVFETDAGREYIITPTISTSGESLWGDTFSKIDTYNGARGNLSISMKYVRLRNGDTLTINRSSSWQYDRIAGLVIPTWKPSSLIEKDIHCNSASRGYSGNKYNYTVPSELDGKKIFCICTQATLESRSVNTNIQKNSESISQYYNKYDLDNTFSISLAEIKVSENDIINFSTNSYGEVNTCQSFCIFTISDIN